MKKSLVLAAAAITLTAGPAYAQASTTQRNPIADIFGALFGDRLGATTSIEGQWAAGQTPLANQRAQFESRVDSEVGTGALNQATGARLKSDYYELVQLEARYGADRRFTTAERTTLADRYGALTQVLADRAYADAGASATTEVADGRAEFDRRVDAALASRQISRAESRRLKNDYAAVARVEHTRVSVTSLCIASGVPPTTALRWIGQMSAGGLLERVEDETDRRRAFIALTDRAAEAMARYFAELGRSAAQLV